MNFAINMQQPGSPLGRFSLENDGYARPPSPHTLINSSGAFSPPPRFLKQRESSYPKTQYFSQKNPISRLQEYVAKEKVSLDYRERSIGNSFITEVYINGTFVAKGKGISKRDSRRAAAELSLQKISQFIKTHRMSEVLSAKKSYAQSLKTIPLKIEPLLSSSFQVISPPTSEESRGDVKNPADSDISASSSEDSDGSSIIQGWADPGCSSFDTDLSDQLQSIHMDGQKQLRRIKKEYQDGKNPISIIMEFSQQRQYAIQFVMESVKCKKGTRFKTHIILDGKVLPAATSTSKQKSKTKSAIFALQKLEDFDFFSDATLSKSMKNVSPLPKIEDLKLPSPPVSISPTDSITSSHGPGKNPLSALQEYSQAQKIKLEYIEVEATGPSHARTFEYCVGLDGRRYESAKAGKIKEAKLLAAQIVLKELNIDIGAISYKDKKKEMGQITDINTPSLTSETFKALNKNPISALQEICQSRGIPVEYVQISNRGPDHSKIFEYAVRIQDQQFPAVTASKVKDARTEAAQIALQYLHNAGWMKNSQTEYEENLRNMPEDQMKFFDQIACMSHVEYNRVVATINTPLTGRKIIASIVMQNGDEKNLKVVTLAQGNRFIRGDGMSLNGDTVIDSHAEILTRRGLHRVFYNNLLQHEVATKDSYFEQNVVGRIKVKDSIQFHLYISMAPCGDGAIFAPREESMVEDEDDSTHNPVFDKVAHGLLRSKMECGEGTIPIEGVVRQTWDGILRGDRLRTMSCSDKICSWNCIGLQGALLSHLIEPVYLSSITLGSLFQKGHLARAVCCRLASQGDEDGDSPFVLPGGFHVNHPRLGRVTVCESQRDTQKSSCASVNWSLGDEQCELTDGTLGLKPDKSPSQLCKKALYAQFLEVCKHLNRQDLLRCQSYRQAKALSVKYAEAKQRLYDKLKTSGRGCWIGIPKEIDMFDLKD